MLGKPVPDSRFPSTGGSLFRLTDQRGKKLVPCFYPNVYPKDATPGCTQEGPDFRESHKAFKSVATEVYGISRELLFRRKVRGIERSTFLIDDQGRLAREWRGVKVPGHIEEVLNFAKAL
jgi:peroxiredoxin Q/BCP